MSGHPFGAPLPTLFTRASSTSYSPFSATGDDGGLHLAVCARPGAHEGRKVRINVDGDGASCGFSITPAAALALAAELVAAAQAVGGTR